MSLDELQRLYGASQAVLLEKLDGADEAFFTSLVPKIFEPDKTEPAATKLAALVFHEIYHAGQLGIIRRAIGKQGVIA